MKITLAEGTSKLSFHMKNTPDIVVDLYGIFIQILVTVLLFNEAILQNLFSRMNCIFLFALEL